MVHRGSFSQCNLFHHWPRMWYYRYIKKYPEIQDYSYANAGTTVHNTVEKLLLNEITEIGKLKEYFNEQWETYNLQNSKIKNLKDSYWLMVLNAKDRNIKCTDIELKIEYSDVLMKLDIYDKDTNEIRDLKTSKRDEQHEKEYKEQVIFYSWGIFRKYGIIPNKCTIDYLQFTGTKGIQEIIPTKEEIEQSGVWYNNCLEGIEKIKIEDKCPTKCKECNQWCPFTEQCSAQDNEFTVKLNIWNNLIYIGCKFDNILNKQLHKKFSYTQTKDSYMNKKWDKPNPIIDFYNEDKHSLPLGFKDQIIKTLTDYAEYKKMKLNLIINDTRKFNEDKIQMPDKFINGHELRYYQKDAGKVILDNKMVVIEIGTGGGKTLLATEVIRQLGYKTLFVVDRKELMTQTIEKIEQGLGIKCGKLGDSERDLQHVTVGMVQTINSCINNYDTEIIEYLKTVRITIFDEFHKCACDSIILLNRYLHNSEYRIGMSGTAQRCDGENLKLYSIAGEIKYSKPAKELIQEGFLMKPNIFFIKDYMTKEEENIILLNCKTGLINEEDDYRIYYNNFIVNNNKRNELLKNIVDNISKDNKRVLILVKLVEHGKMIENMIIGSKYLYGETPKKERDEMYEQFKNGDVKILISMISMFSEGLDLPFLELIINFSGHRNDNKTIQSLGRVLRKYEDKELPKYIDFMDYGKMIKNASITRSRTLKRQGHYVQQLTYNEFIKLNQETEPVVLDYKLETKTI